LRVVHVERAALRDELHQLGAVIVVADVEGDGDAVNAWAGAEDSEASHPHNIPQSASFILAGHVWRHGDVSIENLFSIEAQTCGSAVNASEFYDHLLLQCN